MSHCFCLLNIICWPCILILKWIVPAHVGSSTFPTLEWSSILLWIFWLLSRRSSWLLLNLCWLLLLIPEVRRCVTFLPLVRLLTPFVLPCFLVIWFVLALLVAILSFSYCFFQSSRFIELNLVFVILRKSTQKTLDLHLLIFYVPDIPQQLQKLLAYSSIVCCPNLNSWNSLILSS